jgi:hypothetical protein
MENNLYNFQGAGQDSGVRPIIPETFEATADDFETVTLTWDETNMIADLVQHRHGEAVAGSGTVETDETDLVIGTDTTFTDYKVGDLILIEDETVVYKIKEIIDDLNIKLDKVSGNTDSEKTFSVLPEVDFSKPADVWLGEETAEIADLEAEKTYIFQLRVLKKFKWSDWFLLSDFVVTPAEA